MQPFLIIIPIQVKELSKENKTLSNGTQRAETVGVRKHGESCEHWVFQKKILHLFLDPLLSSEAATFRPCHKAVAGLYSQ